MRELKKLKNRLEKIEKELDKVRGSSPLTDGRQTQRCEKKSRKWDYLAVEKWELKDKIEMIIKNPPCEKCKYYFTNPFDEGFCNKDFDINEGHCRGELYELYGLKNEK